MPQARIVIVEDDRVVARDIREQLLRIGHHIVGVTARGEDAAQLAQTARAELVLMDIRLEGAIDGIDAAKQVRKLCWIPVVFLTAYADSETVRRASETESYGYLIKPFDDTQLRTVIEMALYKHTAETKLRENERRYATTLSSIGDAVIATDRAAKITFMNPVAEELTGWKMTDALGAPIEEVFRIVNEVTRETVEDPAAQALRLGERVELANHTVLLAKNGRELAIDDCGAPIISDSGTTTGAVLVFRDMTHRIKVQSELQRAQEELSRRCRVTTMGELTVTIAHEINQPLMSIVTNAATCLQWLSEEQLDIGNARAAAQRVIRDGHRAGEVVATIRAMAKKSTPSMKPMNMNDVVRHVMALVRSEFRRQSIAEELMLADEDLIVVADQTQLQQVVLNLVMNAIEAIARTTGHTRRILVGSHRISNETIQIEVTDSGDGISSDNGSKIFDALFTTKEDGIGMGLAICRSIIDAHGGQIWAIPNLPRGTTFLFTLPSA